MWDAVRSPEEGNVGWESQVHPIGGEKVTDAMNATETKERERES